MKNNKTTEANKSGLFFVGDVHGCFRELKALLKKSRVNSKKHRVILLGDVINKGPSSYELLLWLKEQKHIQCLLGNHELKWLNLSKKKAVLPPSLKDLEKKLGSQLKSCLEWVQSWPLFLEENDFLAVHGGLVPGLHPGKSPAQYIVNIRHWDGEGRNLNNPDDPPWYELYKGTKTVIYAHWAKQGLKIRKHTIGLDTGCVYGRRLCGMWWPDKTVVCVPAEKKYA